MREDENSGKRGAWVETFAELDRYVMIGQKYQESSKKFDIARCIGGHWIVTSFYSKKIAHTELIIDIGPGVVKCCSGSRLRQ